MKIVRIRDIEGKGEGFRWVVSAEEKEEDGKKMELIMGVLELYDDGHGYPKDRAVIGTIKEQIEMSRVCAYEHCPAGDGKRKASGMTEDEIVEKFIWALSAMFPGRSWGGERLASQTVHHQRGHLPHPLTGEQPDDH